MAENGQTKSKRIDFESLPNEVWLAIMKHCKISTLLQLRNVNSRFFDLVEEIEKYQCYIDEEEKILKALEMVKFYKNYWYGLKSVNFVVRR